MALYFASADTAQENSAHGAKRVEQFEAHLVRTPRCLLGKRNREYPSHSWPHEPKTQCLAPPDAAKIAPYQGAIVKHGLAKYREAQHFESWPSRFRGSGEPAPSASGNASPVPARVLPSGQGCHRLRPVLHPGWLDAIPDLPLLLVSPAECHHGKSAGDLKRFSVSSPATSTLP
jgi:hypothetical protein